MRRRTFIAGFAAAAAPGLLRAAHENGAAEKPVRFGLTPVFLDDHVAFLRVWRQYLESKLSRPVLFIQRGSYREISDMLRQDKLDFAWVCGYPFMRLRRQLRLLAVPLYQGKPLYQSYVIVPSFNTDARSILDLRGQVFAYSDPDSNSGFLYANYRLIELNENPASFFSKAFFTWAHRNVVDAVAAGVARGGSVDGYVWETLQRDSPELTARTRVVEKSPEFGFPPLVARGAASITRHGGQWRRTGAAEAAQPGRLRRRHGAALRRHRAHDESGRPGFRCCACVTSACATRSRFARACSSW